MSGALLIVCAWLLRRVGHARLGDGIETTVLSILGTSDRLRHISTACYQRPYADPWLENADRALGFDWHAFIGIFKEHDTLLYCIVLTYRSLFYQPFIYHPSALDL